MAQWVWEILRADMTCRTCYTEFSDTDHYLYIFVLCMDLYGEVYTPAICFTGRRNGTGVSVLLRMAWSTVSRPPLSMAHLWCWMWVESLRRNMVTIPWSGLRTGHHNGNKFRERSQILAWIALLVGNGCLGFDIIVIAAIPSVPTANQVLFTTTPSTLEMLGESWDVGAKELPTLFHRFSRGSVLFMLMLHDLFVSMVEKWAPESFHEIQCLQSGTTQRWRFVLFVSWHLRKAPFFEAMLRHHRLSEAADHRSPSGSLGRSVDHHGHLFVDRSGFLFEYVTWQPLVEFCLNDLLKKRWQVMNMTCAFQL